MKPIFMMDTGVDDALSILLAVRSSKVHLLGISTVSGNVHVDKALQNTLKLLDEIASPDIPVSRGMENPLAAELVTAEDRS